MLNDTREFIRQHSIIQMTGDKCASVLPHLPPQLRIFKEFDHTLGIRRRILHGNTVAVEAVLDEIVTASDVGNNGGQPTAEGFYDRCWQPFVSRRQYINIRHSIEVMRMLLLTRDNN